MDFVVIFFIKLDVRKTLNLNSSGYEITSQLNYSQIVS